MKQDFLRIPVNIYEGTVELRSDMHLNPLHPYILRFVAQNNDLEHIIESFQF